MRRSYKSSADKCLQKYDYVAIKYIEDPTTWLEIYKHKDLLKISELCFPITDKLNVIELNRNLFIDAQKSEIIDQSISWKQFEDEITIKTRDFIIELETINPILLKIPYFNDILEFVRENGKGS